MTEEKLTEVRNVLEEVLRSTFPNTDFTSLRVRPDLDHDGDEILRVDAVGMRPLERRFTRWRS